MKHYIQITAGRGPVECARAVTLVARELLKAIPNLELTDSEPHNQVDGCFMSMTFTTAEPIPLSIVNDWQGTILWRSTKNPYRPGHKRSNWFVGINFFDEVELVYTFGGSNPSSPTERVCMTNVIQTLSLLLLHQNFIIYSELYYIDEHQLLIADL